MESKHLDARASTTVGDNCFMRASLRIVATTILLVAVACGGNAPAGRGGSASPSATPISFARCEPHGLVSLGERLPDCSFEGLAGRSPVHLTAARGKPLVLNFWASWCPNCIAEMPAFQKVYDDLEGRVGFVGMDLLGIEGETRIAAEAFAKTTEVTYPLAFDLDGGLYSHFSLRVIHPVMPVTVFVDPLGILRERRFGELTEEDLRSVIREHFGIG